MTVVGRAYVTVRAVTRQVENDIQRGVDKAMSNVEDRTAKATGDRLGKGVGEGVEKSGVDKKISESVKKYDADRDGRDIGARLGDSINEGLSDLGGFDRFFRRLSEQLHPDANREGQKVGRTFGQGAVRGAAGVATNPMVWIGALGLPAISDGLSAVNAGIASTTSLATTLGPVIASSAAVGGSAMFTLAQTIGTVTTAFKVKSPELDTFKSSLRGVRDEWIGIVRESQGVLLPAISSTAEGLTENLGPTLRDGMLQTAEAVAVVSDRFVTLSENPAFQRRLGIVLESNAEALKDFGTAGVLAAGGATSILAASAPLTRRFSDLAREAALSANQQLAAAESSGRLEEFFDRAGTTTAQWWRILKDTGGALSNVFSAGVGEGQDLLNMLENQTTRWEQWTESVEGQNAITEWFETATPVMSSFGDLLGGLTEGIGNWAGGNERAAETITAIGNALPGIGGFLGELSEGARDLVAAVAPSASEIGRLGPVVRDAASGIADDLGPALDNAVPSIIDLVEAAIDLVDEFGPVLTVTGEVARVTANILTPALDGAATILDALPDSFVGVAGAAVGLRVALGRLSRTDMLSGLSTRISDQLTQIRTDMDKTQGAGRRFRVGLSGAMGILGGPWGVALGAGVTALGFFMQGQQETKAHIDELIASLNEQTGAFTANSRQVIAKKLEDEGVLEAAERLGIGLGDVTDAILGQGDAADQVGGKLAALRAATTGTMDANMANDINKVGEAIRGEIEVIDDAVAERKRLTEAAAENSDETRVMAGNANAASKVEDQLGRSAAGAAGDIERQADATKDLARQTLVFHEAALKMIQGQIGLEQAVDDAFAEIEKGKKTLDIGTQAGRDNMNALLGIAEAANGVTGSAEKQENALRRGRRTIRDYADQMGYTDTQAKNLANRLIGVKEEANKVPEEVNTKITVEDQDARRKLMLFSAAFRGLDGEVAKTHIVNTIDNVERKLSRAKGGWIMGPGSGTSDSISYGNANVSNLEFVVNAKDAKENASLLEAINSGRLSGESSVVRSQGGSGGGSGTVVYIDKLMPPHYGEFMGQIRSRTRDKGTLGGTDF